MSRSMMSSRPVGVAQRGLTLVEMLISITIGLLVTVAAASVYLIARQGFSTSDDQARTFETGRLVVDQLSRNLRMAGAPSFDPTNLDLNSGGVRTIAAGDHLFGIEGGADPDAISIAYTNIDPYSPTTLLGADCQGRRIGAGFGGGEVVVNSFFIVEFPEPPPAPSRSLLACVGNGPAAGGTGATLAGLNAAMASADWEPIADQVVDMQITYAMAPAAGGGSAVVYVDADDVAGAGGWAMVRSADICLEIVSQANRTLQGAMPGENCRGEAFPADNRVHRLFRFTVNRRNDTVGNIMPGLL